MSYFKQETLNLLKATVIALVYSLFAILLFAIILNFCSFDQVVIKPVNYLIKVLAVFLTHLHFDHICCLEDYLKEWNDADVYIVQGAEEKFLDPQKNCSFIFHENLRLNVPQKNIKYFL